VLLLKESQRCTLRLEEVFAAEWCPQNVKVVRLLHFWFLILVDNKCNVEFSSSRPRPFSRQLTCDFSLDHGCLSLLVAHNKYIYGSVFDLRLDFINRYIVPPFIIVNWYSIYSLFFG